MGDPFLHVALKGDQFGDLAGRFIAKRVPLKTVQRVGGLCMLALAIWSLVEVLAG